MKIFHKSTTLTQAPAPQEESINETFADELLKEILSNLPLQELKKSASVCRLWKHIADEIEVDRERLAEKFPSVDDISLCAWSLIMKRKMKDGSHDEVAQKDRRIANLCRLARRSATTAEMHKMSRYIVALGSLFQNNLEVLERMQELKLPLFVVKAKNYNPYANFLVHIFSYDNTTSKVKKMKEAISLKKLSARGIADSYCLLALKYPIFSQKLLTKAVKQNSLFAHQFLAEQKLFSGKLAECKEHYRLAAEGGIAYAQFMYGKLLLNEGKKEDALIWLGDAALKNVPGAQFLIGSLIAENNEEASSLKSKMVQAGLPLDHLEFGEKISAEELEKQRGTLLCYIDARHQSIAYSILKEFYREGVGVDVDQIKAQKYEQEETKWQKIERIPFKELPGFFQSNVIE